MCEESHMMLRRRTHFEQLFATISAMCSQVHTTGCMHVSLRPSTTLTLNGTNGQQPFIGAIRTIFDISL
jgi:hypothetical protein